MPEAQMQLTLNADEQALLVHLLELELKNTKIEEHRTKVSSYRQHIVQREDVLEGLLKKLAVTVSAV